MNKHSSLLTPFLSYEKMKCCGYEPTFLSEKLFVLATSNIGQGRTFFLKKFKTLKILVQFDQGSLTEREGLVQLTSSYCAKVKYSFSMKNSWYKQVYQEVNCTDPSRSLRIPWFALDFLAMIDDTGDCTIDIWDSSDSVVGRALN